MQIYVFIQIEIWPTLRVLQRALYFRYLAYFCILYTFCTCSCIFTSHDSKNVSNTCKTLHFNKLLTKNTIKLVSRILVSYVFFTKRSETLCFYY